MLLSINFSHINIFATNAPVQQVEQEQANQETCEEESDEYRFFLFDDFDEDELDPSTLHRAEKINKQDEDERPAHEKMLLLAEIYADLGKEHFLNNKEIYAAFAAGLVSGTVITLVIQKILKQYHVGA